MTAAEQSSPPSSPVVGRFTGRLPGPTLVVIGGMHGNEPAGVRALERVVAQLQSTHQVYRGEFLGLIGNRPALSAGARYVDRDLNRRWGPAAVSTGATAEDNAQRTLHDALHATFDRARGPVHILDLHTMSGPGRPFTVFADTIRSRTFACRFRVPLLLGFEEHLDGALVDYLAALGHAAVAVEGGRHDDPESIERLHAAAWVGIGACSLLANPGDDEILAARRTLHAVTAGLPTALEIIHRHSVTDRSQFEMKPGYATFDWIASGDLVATDHGTEVSANHDGYLMLPLYQQLGDDGFFIAWPVNPFWLALSRVLRVIRLGRLVPYLPGVSRDPTQPGDLLVNRAVARWGTLQILHLLGYRRLADDGAQLRVRRRRHDLP